jgi:glutamate dehydrogenase/leucine dehydrogenase
LHFDGIDDTEVITNEELIELDVDILIAATLENVITKKSFAVNMRQAAYAVAVDRVVEAMRLRWWV